LVFLETVHMVFISRLSGILNGFTSGHTDQYFKNFRPTCCKR